MKDITINDLKALVSELNEATDNYDVGCPIMTDAEWDDKYYTLIEWERILNTILPNSPTIRINSKISDKLEKVEHNHPMLSLSKTKDLSVLENFINSTRYTIMAKMDGLTCSLTYRDGNLFRAETRGNGMAGENITSAAMMVPSIPKAISIKDEVIIDGEIICTYGDFTKWSNKFANPRNFAAGSIRLLDNKEVAARNLTFVAWDCIEGINENSLFVKLDTLEKIGFIVVPRFYWTSFGSLIEAQINQLKRICSAKGYPIDGVVVKYDECDYYASLGTTAHHPLAAMAFKFYDESYPTKLIDIEWTMGRTGVLTPVAIFEEIEIDGCKVNRANIHNINIMNEVIGKPYIGQVLNIYKANEIIPEIESAEPPLDGELHEFLDIPTTCPVCGEKVYVNDSGFLICPNQECEGKMLNRLNHFLGKNGLDVKGISKATLSKLMEWGWVNDIPDLYKLQDHAAEWVKKPGFGAKSVGSILSSIETNRKPTLDKFIAAIGIPLIGNTHAKEITKHFPTYDLFREAVDCKFDFSTFEGFGVEKMRSILEFDYTIADEVSGLMLGFSNEEVAAGSSLKDMVICITGSVKHFKNRDEWAKFIVDNGGKISSAVSKNTTVLINNDTESTSSKNLTAKKLGIPIMSEQEFLQKYI